MSAQLATIYGLFFASAFLLVQLVIGAGRQANLQEKFANFRMALLDKTSDKDKLNVKLLTKRGLDDEGNIAGVLRGMKVMVLRSGLHIGVANVLLAMGVLAIILATMLYVLKGSTILAAIGFMAGLVLPILVLMFLVKRRRNKAAAQLPEALDIIVRSLRAGHPVPVAIELVAREMPDPLGSEFGLVNDEITYGTTLGEATQRLAYRIGQTDFDLFAANVRLQAKTGGNLTELLSSNASTIRARQKMRLKIKAATSEGRMSALILNVTPVLLFAAINFMAPDFYGDFKDEPALKFGLLAAGVWMFIGNLVMRKMINFKI